MPTTTLLLLILCFTAILGVFMFLGYLLLLYDHCLCDVTLPDVCLSHIIKIMHYRWIITSFSRLITFALSCWETHRQTDRQTNKQTNSADYITSSKYCWQRSSNALFSMTIGLGYSRIPWWVGVSLKPCFSLKKIQFFEKLDGNCINKNYYYT